jgi:hypothetical protein
VAGDSAQEATGVGPVGTVLQCCVSVGTQTDAPTAAVQPQVVVVHWLSIEADWAVHDDTPVGPVFTTGQVVAVHPSPLFAECVWQLSVGVGPLTTVGQSVLVQELSELAAATVHDATPPEVVCGWQSVSIQEFELLAASGVQV